MAAVAKGFVGGLPAAAQPSFGDAVDGAPGAAAYLQIALDLQWPILLRSDDQGAVAHGERLRFARCRFAAGGLAMCGLFVVPFISSMSSADVN